MSICLFVRLSATRSCRSLADWCARVAARGDAQPQRRSDTWTMGGCTTCFFFREKLPREIYASGEGLLVGRGVYKRANLSYTKPNVQLHIS